MEHKIYNVFWSLVLMVVYAASPHALAATEVGRFTFVYGDVRIESVDGQQRAAEKGSSVVEGDSVETGPQASAQLKMIDDAAISVRPATRIKIEAYRYAGQQDSEEKGIIGLFRGGMRSVTGWIGKLRKKSYFVRTPTATIGIRGTDHEPYYVPVPANGEVPIGDPGTYDKVNDGGSYIETQAGRIDIDPAQVGFVSTDPLAIPKLLDKEPPFYQAPFPGMDSVPQTSCTFSDIAPITIGPKEDFGESLKKDVADQAQGVVGGLLGGLFGGSSPVSFGGGGGEPEMADDPVKTKQRFVSSDGSTVIEAGVVPDAKGGMRLSVHIDEAESKGAVHAMTHEVLGEDCQTKVEMPSDLWLYEIWQEWKLSVWWSKETYVNNQRVKTESGGWSKEGNVLLDRGVFDAANKGLTPWGYFGFERPYKGPRDVGASFAEWKPQPHTSLVKERIIVHVAEPQRDPVTTTVFVLYPRYHQDGSIELSPTP